jgi:vesicle-fusing ATPase
VPSISNIASLEHVLREVELFDNERNTKEAVAMLQEAGFGHDDRKSPVLSIGVKKLLSLIEMARQEPDAVADRLVSALMGLGM